MTHHHRQSVISPRRGHVHFKSTGLAVSREAESDAHAALGARTQGLTQPTMVYFDPERSRETERQQVKVYLRTLLYATSKRGRIIESMFVRLRRGETSQNFNFWVYGEDTLHRGSGLFIPDNGVATNHHFVLPPDGTAFEFLPGIYRVEVYASLVGDKKTRLLRAIRLSVSPRANRQSISGTVPTAEPSTS